MYRRFHFERLRLIQRLGRRGILLILLGLAWIGVGISNLIIRIDRFSSPGIGTDTILQMLDGPEINFIWIGAGSIAFLVGCFHDRRIVSKHEALGWNAVLTLPLLWMFFYIWSFWIYVATDGNEGRGAGLYGCIVWALVSTMIMIVAGWPEEKLPIKPSESEETKQSSQED
jgi:hypothetical protein